MKGRRLQIALKVLRRFLGFATDIEGADETTVLVHEIDDGRVVDRIIFVLAGRAFRIDAIFAQHGVDRARSPVTPMIRESKLER